MTFLHFPCVAIKKRGYYSNNDDDDNNNDNNNNSNNDNNDTLSCIKELHHRVNVRKIEHTSIGT